ncbi:MAG: nickel pincer cofactor biosynthesis protein LarC [Deltaproteobacteria bacterium]|nr:nickel pincer cofactor biosynthesis protein LarC [Deltaproteobacteria bacterium]
MKLLYFDCPMGISGDMCLGALIDLGVDFKTILRELKKLPVDKIDIRLGKELRHSITGTTFRVNIRESHHHRTFREIRGIIKKSALTPEVKDLSIKIFGIIAVAEGRIHGVVPDQVHFHEVGAMDSIIDIVGASVAITSLKADKIIASPVPLGSGWADTMHGRIPIPAPATVEILKGVPVAASNVPFELTTPTGAAILKAVVDDYGPMPSMVIERTGYGAGKKDFKESANLLRVMTGETGGKTSGLEDTESLTVVETNIDDMSPQVSGYLMERLFSAGARDVFFTPVQMKKSRPGVLLTVLADAVHKMKIIDMIFEESTSIGIRCYPVERHCLERKTVKVKTPWGPVSVKISLRGGRAVNAQPEYEECRLLAEKKKVPLKKVMEEAAAALKMKKGGLGAK